MGHRRNRKRDRQARRPAADPFPLPFVAPAPFAPLGDDFALTRAFLLRHETPAGTACGRCREFVEDHDGGRGTCLHPGSGVLSPWTDTPACPFFARRR
ncbi:MAG: hypothetical protein IT304_08260 [Dehalococcoidia bacterium]|nr:hypothetical protein [Dehalococcoidia bacterium]